MHNPQIAKEFDIDLDLDADITPGAGAPGPRPDKPTPAEMLGLDGVFATRLATAALFARMSDGQVWAALDAVSKVAILALEEGKLSMAKRAVARQEALTREIRRRAER